MSADAQPDIERADVERERAATVRDIALDIAGTPGTTRTTRDAALRYVEAHKAAGSLVSPGAVFALAADAATLASAMATDAAHVGGRRLKPAGLLAARVLVATADMIEAATARCVGGA